MAEVVTWEVSGGAETLALLAAVHPTLVRGQVVLMRQVVTRLQRYVKGAKLSGQVLRNRTGNLRRSIGQQVTQPSETAVEGTVGIYSGPTLGYGAAHEYGWDKQVTVRAHIRRIHVARGSRGASSFAQVRSHTRHSVGRARRYLRGSLEEMAPAITQLFDDQVDEIVKKLLSDHRPGAFVPVPAGWA